MRCKSGVGPQVRTRVKPARLEGMWVGNGKKSGEGEEKCGRVGELDCMGD